MMSDDPQRVLRVNDPIDNMRGVTQRVKEESTIDNTRGVTRRVYVVGGGGGNIDELNVTPSTSAQTITASGGTDGYSPVNVAAVTSSIDANITAGNIKNGVSILGVTGNYTGNTPTGTMYIISNGTYNVADKAIANVQVPTTAPAHYIEKTVDANGKLINSSYIMDFTGVTDVGDYILYNTYRDNIEISGAVDMSDLTTVSGTSACQYMFQNCSGITSIDLSSLTTISGANSCQYMFNNCSGITSIDLSSLTSISGGNACQYMFQNCTGITSVDLSSLTTIHTVYACASMFKGCTSLTSANLSGLTTIDDTYACQYMFQNCTSLTTVRIGNTTAINFGIRTNQFTSMFSGCTQNIDVYAPAASKSAIEAFPNYPNFGGTGTVTWHWNS